jgi:tight adherence protein B
MTVVGEAAVYGLVLGVAGMFLSAAATSAAKERILHRIGAEASQGRSLPEPGEHGELRADVASTRSWPWGLRTYIATHVAGAALAAAVGFRLAGPIGALGAAAGMTVSVESWLSRRRTRRRYQADEQLRETVMALAAGTRAGLSLRRSLAEAVRDAEPPLREVLEAALRRVEIGERLEDALEELGRGSSDARLLVTLLAVHRRTGGDLPSLLDDVADILGRRTEGRRQARALSAQGRASGAVLAALPVAFVGLLSGTSGSGLGSFYRTATGSTLLLAGLALQGLGFLWLRRITKSVGIT